MSDDWELIVLIRQKGQINLFRDVDARSRSFEGLLGFLSIGSLSPARVFVLTYMLRVTNAYSKKKKKKKKKKRVCWGFHVIIDGVDVTDPRVLQVEKFIGPSVQPCGTHWHTTDFGPPLYKLKSTREFLRCLDPLPVR
jgi:hypothetical protein